ncbi:hypothetical protein MRX96_045941, partial [Rhipicephalus microplus]
PLAQLVVYFKALTYDHMRPVPKHDETTVLRNLGGFIGMYLALSFLVIFQVLGVLVVGTLRLWKMLRISALECREVALLPERVQSRAAVHN